MQEKHEVYIIAFVGLVAIIGLFFVFFSTNIFKANNAESNSVTGSVVEDVQKTKTSAKSILNTIAILLFIIACVALIVYSYKNY